MDSKRQRLEDDDAVASMDGPTPMDAANDSVDGVLADAAAAQATPDDAAAATLSADDEEEKHLTLATGNEAMIAVWQDKVGRLQVQ